ncbi:MAG TPA: hypothetical protein VMM16_13275 [Verrucomicrobiae bacterium]|nr:hypothetical protein [Verrucomicrobiae bacterium]
MKRGIALSVVLLVLGGVVQAQESNFQIDVLSYQWTTTHNTLTFTYPGSASTSCNGNASMNGYVSGGGNIYANGTSSSTCSTSYTPPSTQDIDIQKPVVYILADSETTRMILACTRNVRWSQCHALNPGRFVARINNGHFEVQALSNKNKEEWIRFDVVQQAAISRQQAQPVSAQPASAPATIEAPGSDASGFPSRWKSMTSGTVRTIRVDGDYLYAEVVFTDAAARAGMFALTETKVDGDKYTGKTNGRLMKSATGPSCTISDQIEFTLVTPSRIEGRVFGAPPGATLDWSTCTYSLPDAWQSFVWIPVK